jgi:hypothetical protein
MTRLSGPNERRRMRRRTTTEDHGILTTRVRPGYHATVIDVSAAGVLIETDYRLLPGSSVELHMTRTKEHVTIRGRIIRSAVSGLKPSSVSYRGAIGFDRPLGWFADDSSDEYQVPSAGIRAGHGFRADATPKIA